jgi:hypothetical protein
MKKEYNSMLVCAVALATSIGVNAQEKLIVLNEGNWQSDNGKVSYFEDGKIVSNQWFRDVNGYKIGDTPNDIIQVRPNLIAITVNWSNIVQFIDATGKAVSATEDIPNNRRLATDGNYVYVTSYGHECGTINGTKEFEKGYVAKIDANTYKVVDATEVGYEPEGIAYYKGKLFVANTGGYAFQEGHEYETTVSVLDAATMKLERNVDTGQINLYSKMSQSGQYLCVNSPGDYYDIPGATIIIDTEAVLNGKPDNECFVSLTCASTYNCTAMDGNFYAVGAGYSYNSGDYAFNYLTIDPQKAFESEGSEGIEDIMPGTIVEDLQKMEMPYGIYVNPYTGYIYGTDAAGFVEGGTLYQWSPEGKLLGKYGVYINPGHFLALNPKGESGISSPTPDTTNPDDDTIYNLQGMKVDKVMMGEIYIKNGIKYIAQ